MRIKETEIKVVCADVRGLNVDAIVCPAHLRAKQDVTRFNPSAENSPAFWPGMRLPPSGGNQGAPGFSPGGSTIIPVVVQTTSGKTNENILRRACRQAFKSAQELKISSLAIPALGSGIGGFPAIGSAKILAQETLRHLRAVETGLREIIFWIEDAQSFAAFEKNLIGYVRHIQEDLSQGPYLTADAIIELPQGVVVIERSNPPYGWALPGGFVDPGESLEQAVRREMKEETGLALLDLRQFHVYSDPRRDPRFHTVTAVFVARGKGTPKAGDDAKGLKVVPYQDLLKLRYAFDHKKVMADYVRWRKNKRRSGNMLK